MHLLPYQGDMMEQDVISLVWDVKFEKTEIKLAKRDSNTVEIILVG